MSKNEEIIRHTKEPYRIAFVLNALLIMQANLLKTNITKLNQNIEVNEQAPVQKQVPEVVPEVEENKTQKAIPQILASFLKPNKPEEPEINYAEIFRKPTYPELEYIGRFYSKANIPGEGEKLIEFDHFGLPTTPNSKPKEENTHPNIDAKSARIQKELYIEKLKTLSERSKDRQQTITMFTINLAKAYIFAKLNILPASLDSMKIENIIVNIFSRCGYDITKHNDTISKMSNLPCSIIGYCVPTAEYEAILKDVYEYFGFQEYSEFPTIQNMRQKYADLGIELPTDSSKLPEIRTIELIDDYYSNMPDERPTKESLDDLIKSLCRRITNKNEVSDRGSYQVSKYIQKAIENGWRIEEIIQIISDLDDMYTFYFVPTLTNFGFTKNCDGILEPWIDGLIPDACLPGQFKKRYSREIKTLVSIFGKTENHERPTIAPEEQKTKEKKFTPKQQ